MLPPSTRRNDLGRKRARYELLRVGEYWVLDSELRTATVFRREVPGFLPPIAFSAKSGDRLTTPLLPDLEIPHADVFRSSKPEVK